MEEGGLILEGGAAQGVRREECAAFPGNNKGRRFCFYW